MNNPTEWKNGIISDIKKMAQKAGDQIDNAAKRSFSVLRHAARVRTGNFVQNWNYSVDSPNLSYVERKRKSLLSANIKRADEKISSFEERKNMALKERAMYATNSTPYAEQLDREDDYLGKAEAEFDRIIDTIS